MKASWEKLESNVGVLTIEVEAEQVNEAINKAFKKVANRVNVPGFRKGKVPRQIFEAKFGVESLYQDAIDIILPEAYTYALQETGIEPIDRPEVDIEKFAKNEPMKLTAKVQVKPEVQLGEYKGLEVEAKSDDVTDEEIDAELNRLQQRHAEIVPVEEGVAQNGDIAVIDFEGFADGVPFEGGKGEKHSLELGSGSFIPGFEEGVVGMAKGEEKEVQVTFPEDYHAENLKGQAATFKVKLQDLKRKNLPELDDEFAKDVSEFETLEEFKKDLSDKIKARKEREFRIHQEQSVVDQASDNATVDVPAVMVETELNNMVKEFESRLRTQGMTLELYFQFTNTSEDALREQMLPDAQKRVRNNLVLEAIAKAEGLEASDEDLEKELERMAEQFQRSVEEIRGILSANGRIDDIREELSIKRAVDFLVDNSKTK
ncbi:trigger factor [Paenibacillus antri]|uniref:Trigger factor n=1 Tax=Paenibacillus antri TaxID=2582848 RepID=A0A5R9GKH7_9BACL|nr:trigger factor [Paenibacillus antri]TLS53493.1 trigger factor [Paenibacillus antri]